MSTKYKFDQQKGIMVPAETEITVSQNTTTSQPKVLPNFKETKKIEVKQQKNSVLDNRLLRMKRSQSKTPIQLLDENGRPEAYLDSVDSGISMFRDGYDYDLYQISDEKTGKVLAFIGGYALQINFNMSELKTLEKIEQCLQGITKLFRHKIMSQTVEYKQDS